MRTGHPGVLIAGAPLDFRRELLVPVAEQLGADRHGFADHAPDREVTAGDTRRDLLDHQPRRRRSRRLGGTLEVETEIGAAAASCATRTSQPFNGLKTSSGYSRFAPTAAISPLWIGCRLRVGRGVDEDQHRRARGAHIAGVAAKQRGDHRA